VNRVVWEEGMFLAPQHFQAQRQHFEETLGHSIEALFPFGYGVTSAALDTDALGGGTLVLSHARGIFPDGTPVAVPEADRTPTPLFAGARHAHRAADVARLAERRSERQSGEWNGDRAHGRVVHIVRSRSTHGHHALGHDRRHRAR
jgi:type VI secretion system protein ImpJ